MMATEFNLGQLGVTFEVKLIDCISDTAFDTSQIDTVFIQFRKTDGTVFEKVADLVTDPEIPAEKLIQYRNIPPETSILDVMHGWEYAGGGVLTNGGTFRTSEKKLFWVVT